jgi:hypothetical protein
MGVLTALRTLCVEAPLISIPTSMRALTGLRELTIYAPSEETDDTHMLLTEMAFCLPWWRDLRKLCIFGSGYRTAIQKHNDTIAIGLALRAWPLQYLDIMDKHVSDDFTKDAGFLGELPPACIFGFKLHWRSLGLPAEAGSWDDGEIMQYWRMQMSKIDAFVMVTHRRLGLESEFLGLPENIMAEVANMLGGMHDFTDADRKRGPLRITQHREECERKAEQMALQEKQQVLEEQREREETAAHAHTELELLYAEELAHVQEQYHLEMSVRITALNSGM